VRGRPRLFVGGHLAVVVEDQIVVVQMHGV
jgi:hypothetical protein